MKNQLNCFITNTFEYAIEMAKESDKKISRNQEIRDLEGIPIGMKDLFCTKGIRTTAGKNFGEFRSILWINCIKKFTKWWCGNFRKTNMDEFAMGSA